MEENKIYCGDCLDLIEQLDINPKLIVMSPPDLENNYTIEKYEEFINKIYNRCIDKLDKHGVLFSSTTDRKMKGKIYLKHQKIISAIGNKADLFNYKIWAKSLGINLYILNYTHMLFFRKNKKITNNKIKEFYPDVWDIRLDKVKGYKNKDAFPSELVRRVILNFTNPNDLVLDPFIGSGKTACLAQKYDRKFIGFELSKKNVETANRFIASHM